MTREEIADKLEVLARGIRKGETIQDNYGGEWKDVSYHRLEQLALGVRIKPEPTYVPFTADDWREFSDRTVKHKSIYITWIIIMWTQSGVLLSNNEFYTYQFMLDEYVFDIKDIPFGKEVKK